MRLLVGWGINVLALIVADWVFDGVEIGRWGPLLLGAAVLGIANATIKPILTILTLPLVIVTLALFLLAINVALGARGRGRKRRTLSRLPQIAGSHQRRRRFLPRS